MTEKRFQLNKDCEWWFVKDNTIKVNEFGYRDDVVGEDKYRGLKQELTELAYFRGEIRRCSYEINWIDEDGNLNSSYAAVRGPVETKINFI